MKPASACITVAALAISGVLGSGSHRMPFAQAQSVASDAAKDAMNSMEPQIVAKEREVLDALKTGDLALFGKLTADEAVMVDTQGPANKIQVLKNVAEFKLTDYSMDDVKFVAVSATAGLISYKITEQGISHGHEFTAKVYVSSLWTKRGSGWVCLFSQETGTK